MARLGNMEVGSTVKIKVNGAVKDFIIVQQGNPDSAIYDASCNGTWLLMKDIYENRVWDSSSEINNYANSSIHSYLNSTFLNKFDADIRGKIKQVNIPHRDITIPAKIFLLSTNETKIRSAYVSSVAGATLPFFKDCSSTGSDYRRVAYLNGSAAGWWLRSVDDTNCGRAMSVDKYGGGYVENCHNSYGIRPAFILSPELSVLDDGTVTVNQPPEITSDAGESGVALGEKNEPFTLSYTVTDGDGDTLTITEKMNGVELAVHENVASGTEMTVQCLSEKALFKQILNGENTLTLEVSDGKTTVDWTATFTKNVTSVVISLAQPLTADDTITVAALTLEGSFPADMRLTVELTNNALDGSPAWETVTDIQSGEAKAVVHHSFANATAGKGFAFNYKITAARGASGVGGNITMIGGVIG